MGEKTPSNEVYFEFLVIGQSIRVSAVDAATGTEVVVIGPRTATQPQLQQLALGKLKRRLAAGPS